MDFHIVYVNVLIIVCIIVSLAGIICTIISLRAYIKIKRITEGLEKMTDNVISGEFNASLFDETKMSKLEMRMSDFLEKSSISQKNIREEQERIKSLIADISHQTKTPIANILLYSELLEEQDLPQESRDIAEKITQQSEKLDFLIRSLVKTSRLENGVITVQPKSQDVLPMLESVIKAVSEKAAAKNIDIVFDNDTGGTAFFDLKWTEESVLNVLDNAVKYTDNGGKINISVNEYEFFLRIDISDNGIGIKEDEQSMIFQRFYRSSDVSEKEGVGIGLYLVRSILTAEGGYVKVSSEYGKGSVFSLCLKK